MSDGGAKATRGQKTMIGPALAEKPPAAPEHIDGLRKTLKTYDFYGARWSTAEPAGVRTAAHYRVAKEDSAAKLMKNFNPKNPPFGFIAHVLEQGAVVFQRRISEQVSYLSHVKMK